MTTPLDEVVEELEHPNILIVIDMQNDFIEGVFGTEEAEAIVTDVADVVAKYKSYGNPVIFTQDTHEAVAYDGITEAKFFPPHCVRGTWGWKISGAIDTYGCEIIQKNTFGCPELITKIHDYFMTFKNIPIDYQATIQIVGLCTDICVISNALLLQTMFPYADIIVNPNLCAGTTSEKHLEALDIMQSCCINVTEYTYDTDTDEDETGYDDGEDEDYEEPDITDEDDDNIDYDAYRDY